MQSKQLTPTTPQPSTPTTSTTNNASTTPFQLAAPAEPQQLPRAMLPPTGVERSISTDQNTDRRLSTVCAERPQHDNASLVPFHPAQAEIGRSSILARLGIAMPERLRPGRRRPRRHNHNRCSTTATYHGDAGESDLNLSSALNRIIGESE